MRSMSALSAAIFASISCVLRQVGVGLGFRRERHLGLDVAEQRCLEPVVVLLRNRIELVVVAAGAVDRQPERAFANRADDLVEIVVPPLRVVLLAKQHARTHAQKSGGDEAVVGSAVHLVAGDLLDQEAVVRLVVVERLDHVVAVTPGIGAMGVVLEARRVRVARDVEPEPSVAFAVVRRGEQAVDEAFPRIRRSIRDERIDLRRCRRQAKQIEIGASNQRVAVGFRRRLHRMRTTRRLEEAIDGVREPAAHVGKGRLHRQLERPVVPLLRRNDPVLQRGERGRGPGRVRRGRRIPSRAFVNPLLQRSDFLWRERFAFRRHRRLLQAGDAAIQPAVRGVAGDQVGAARSAAQKALARAEIEPAHRRRVAMARPATPLEDRLDVVREGDGRRLGSGNRLRAQESGSRPGGEESECDRRETLVHRRDSFLIRAILAK